MMQTGVSNVNITIVCVGPSRLYLGRLLQFTLCRKLFLVDHMRKVTRCPYLEGYCCIHPESKLLKITNGGNYQKSALGQRSFAGFSGRTN